MNLLSYAEAGTRIRGCLMAAGVLLGVGAAQADVYRCADAAGKVTYQAQPCPDSSAGRAVPLTSAPAPAPARAPAPPQARRSAGGGWSLVTEDGVLAAPPGPPTTSAAPAAQSWPGPEAVAAPSRRQRVLAPAPAPQGAAQWGRGADVLVVSGYEFSDNTTQVHVNHPDRPVLLVLSSYEQTQWRVLPAPGTSIRAVIVASYENRSVVQAPPQVPVVQDELPYAVETAGRNFRNLISKLAARYGVEKVAAFRGGYSLPALVPVKGPYVPDPNLTLEGLRPEIPRVRINFPLLSIDGRRLDWTNTGPKDGKRYTGIVRGGGFRASHGGAMAVGDNGEAYVLEGSTLLWLPKGPGGPSQKVELPKNLPKLSWGSGLAWDTKRGVLALVSFGGEGHFYRFDTKSKQWLGARSLRNKDLHSLAQDATTGAYLSISSDAELLIFNGQGEIEEIMPLAKLLPDLDSTYDKGNERPEGLMVAANGGVVAIINVRDGSVTHIWTYELRSRKAQLTYKMVN